nr:reverse transcriptase domain-containing protein [Tanacetum cinerariifolium]
MVNVIPPDLVDEVPVVEPNQYDDASVVLEPVLVDEDKDLKEDEFEEEEDPQEEEYDMEINIKEDENELELTHPYEEVDPLNSSSPTSKSEPDDKIEVENPIEHEDNTVPASVQRDINSLFGQMAFVLRRLCGRETSHALVEKKGKVKDMFYAKLILELGNEVRSGVKQGTTAMEKLVEKLGNTEDKTRVRAHEFYQEMIHRGFVFEERPNEAMNISIKDEKSPSSEPIISLKSAPMTQAAIRRIIKDSVNAAIATERARQANVKNDASGSGPVRGQDAAPVVQGKKVKFAAATLDGPALTWWKTKVATMGLETRFNELALMCPRMVELKRVKVDAYIRGLTDNIKGEVTSSKPADMNEAVRMAHKLMEQKSKTRDARILKERNESGRAFMVEIVVVKQGEVGEARGRAYAIKDAKPQGPNVVTGTFLLNNRYDFVLFDSGFDRSFMDTKFSAMLNIDPLKIGASYEVELADGRLVKHDGVIVYGKKVVCLPYGNEMLIVESYKGVSRLKVISCIKARLPSPRQVEFRIDLVPRVAPVARAPYRLAPFEMKELSGEYLQWRERFMKYPEGQIDGEAMINSIQNGDKPLPVIAQVSLAVTTQNAPPTLKDPKFWTAEEKKTQKIDRLARSLLIQGLPNDIYSLIDSNKTAKDLWDALERQMRGSEYGEQDRKAATLYEFETFKANEGEQLLDTYLCYLQVINDLKKFGYKKETNLMDINIETLYNILNQNQGDVNDALGYNKKAVVINSDPLALVAEKTNVNKRKEKFVVSSDSEGSGTDDFSELKKITALLAKAFNRRMFYYKPTNNNLRTSSTSQSANKKQEFVKSNDKKEDKKANEKKRDMSKVKCYNCKKEGHFSKDCKKAKVKYYNYYKTKMFLAKKDSDE